MQFAKAIGLTQYLGPMEGGNYETPDTESCLVELQHIKDLQKAIENEEADIRDENKPEPIKLTQDDIKPIEDPAEKFALGYVIGVLLKRTIFSKSFCQICVQAFVIKEGDNRLIHLKEYRKGCLIHPSELATAMFHDAESIFRQKNDEFKRNSLIGNEISQIVQDFLSSKYDKAPKCHLKLIIDRFTKARAHFWAFDTNQQELLDEENKKVAKQEASASKTAKAMIEIK